MFLRFRGTKIQTIDQKTKKKRAAFLRLLSFYPIIVHISNNRFK